MRTSGTATMMTKDYRTEVRALFVLFISTVRKEGVLSSLLYHAFNNLNDIAVSLCLMELLKQIAELGGYYIDLSCIDRGRHYIKKVFMSESEQLSCLSAYMYLNDLLLELCQKQWGRNCFNFRDTQDPLFSEICRILELEKLKKR